MSNTGQFRGMRPIKTTTYTSGSGTFTPQAGTAWLEIVLQAPGGGGAMSGNIGGGGGGGEALVASIPASGAMAYAVGAAGTGAVANGPGGDAGNVTLGHLIAFGGKAGAQGNTGANGGAGGGATQTPANGARLGAIPGGAGGGYYATTSTAYVATDGRAAGLPVPYTNTLSTIAELAFGGGSGTASMASGGGGSLLSKGGAGSTGSGVAPVAVPGYGGGGGAGKAIAGAAGAGGYISIKEYAA